MWNQLACRGRNSRGSVDFIIYICPIIELTSSRFLRAAGGKENGDPVRRCNPLSRFVRRGSRRRFAREAAPVSWRTDPEKGPDCFRPRSVGFHGGRLSAGAGLAAGLALLARDRAEVAIGHQLLIYPMIDDRHGNVS